MEESILDQNNIGISVVKCKGEVLYAANITTHNHEIPKLPRFKDGKLAVKDIIFQMLSV